MQSQITHQNGKSSIPIHLNQEELPKKWDNFDDTFGDWVYQ